MAKIVSINIGKPGDLNCGGSGALFSGISKKPVTGRVFLTPLGFEGDGVANTKVHGGPDKAVCAYAFDHYRYWKDELARKFEAPMFGENLTISSIDEKTVHIGDVFSAGETEVQISQPRQPCQNLCKFHGLPDLASRMQKTGYTGFYFRVLKPGWVVLGDELTLLRQDEKRISISLANNLMYQDKCNWEKIRDLLSVPFLSASWRETFSRRLKKEEGS